MELSKIHTERMDLRGVRFDVALLMTLFGLVLAFTVRLSANELGHPSTFNGEIDEFYMGVRSLGMGGVYVNTVNDETALLTNPAGLGKIRETTLVVVDPEIHGAFKSTEVFTLSNASELLDLQGVLNGLNRAPGARHHSRAQVFPALVTNGFGIGLLYKNQTNAMVSQDSTQFRLDHVEDWAAVLGYNMRFWGGIVKLGVTGRLVNRSEIHADLDPASTGLTYGSLALQGMGLAADGGLILTAPVAALPALGLVVRDVGNTRYDFRPGLFNSTTEKPGETKQTVDAALSFQPLLGNHTRSTFAVDYRGVTSPLDPERETFLKRLHVGAEFNFSDFAFLRFGANQGYWTAGVELATEKIQLQFASYGEEVGFPNALREDRRWVFQFSFRL